MGGTIGPGDWVECVDNGPWPGAEMPVNLTVGALYQCEECGCDDIGGWVTLVAVVADTLDGVFDIGRFRSIYRPRADLIESLKQPASRKREPA